MDLEIVKDVLLVVYGIIMMGAAFITMRLFSEKERLKRLLKAKYFLESNEIEKGFYFMFYSFIFFTAANFIEVVARYTIGEAYLLLIGWLFSCSFLLMIVMAFYHFNLVVKEKEFELEKKKKWQG